MAARKKAARRTVRAKAKSRTSRVTPARASGKVRKILRAKRDQAVPSARRSALAPEDHSPLSQRELERASDPSREAAGRQARELAKRHARYERGQRGQPGARSREARDAEH
jgi:hypothetical protein